MDMLTEKKISVVVVCYRDAGSIQELYRKVKGGIGKNHPAL